MQLCVLGAPVWLHALPGCHACCCSSSARAPVPNSLTCKNTQRREGEPTRRELARKIKATIASAAAAGDGSLQLLDLEGPFDWDAMSGQRRAQVFDDGIHLTEWGYTSMLADLIYNGLVKVMAI